MCVYLLVQNVQVAAPRIPPTELPSMSLGDRLRHPPDLELLIMDYYGFRVWKGSCSMLAKDYFYRF